VTADEEKSRTKPEGTPGAASIDRGGFFVRKIINGVIDDDNSRIESRIEIEEQGSFQILEPTLGE
jgi:hypothetical protein